MFISAHIGWRWLDYIGWYWLNRKHGNDTYILRVCLSMFHFFWLSFQVALSAYRSELASLRMARYENCPHTPIRTGLAPTCDPLKTVVSVCKYVDYPLVNVYITMGKQHFFVGKSTISMAMFNSKLLVYQRVLFPGINPVANDYCNPSPSRPSMVGTGLIGFDRKCPVLSESPTWPESSCGNHMDMNGYESISWSIH